MTHVLAFFYPPLAVDCKILQIMQIFIIMIFFSVKNFCTFMTPFCSFQLSISALASHVLLFSMLCFCKFYSIIIISKNQHYIFDLFGVFVSFPPMF